MRDDGKTAGMSDLLQAPYYVGIVVMGILPIMNPFSTVPLVIALKFLGVPDEGAEQLRQFADELRQELISAVSVTGGHFGAVLLQNLTHTEFPLVHYRGGGPALSDLLAGHVDLTTNQATVFLPHMREGTIKVFAVLADHKLAQAPEIPTADEAGLPGFHVSNWNGFWAPKGTPKDVIARLNAAVIKVMADPAMTQQLLKLTYEIPAASEQTPEALAKLQKAEIEKWWPIIKAAKITSN